LITTFLPSLVVHRLQADLKSPDYQWTVGVLVRYEDINCIFGKALSSSEVRQCQLIFGALNSFLCHFGRVLVLLRRIS